MKKAILATKMAHVQIKSSWFPNIIKISKLRIITWQKCKLGQRNRFDSRQADNGIARSVKAA